MPPPAVGRKLDQRASEVVRLDPPGPVLPVIPLVVRLRSQREVRGVHAQAIVTAMPDDLFPAHRDPLQDAVDEAVGVDLTTSKYDFSGWCGNGQISP